jgi:hypothetical protein
LIDGLSHYNPIVYSVSWLQKWLPTAAGFLPSTLCILNIDLPETVSAGFLGSIYTFSRTEFGQYLYARQMIRIMTPTEYPTTYLTEYPYYIYKTFIHIIYTRHLYIHIFKDMAVCQNLVPLVNIKIAGKWMFIPLKMYL